MSLDGHLATLQQKHAAIEAELEAAILSPAMSDVEIRDMKRRKLLLKDEMERLRNSRH
ncbi:DUF465 domain-containing protein [Aureimonas endophytica]|uniref:DUF465 domain-containing protein n=2 Tax=Aureimonas endophytica TaxID=2027858 RepID=A0A916ZFM5_9HYPH|nr:DUF465 domain-containing protein [Aureimonas endophytica]GGD95085.1 DUF465 domain-containing protein [Aureimonas endophytica]